MTEQDLIIQDLRVENAKLKQELDQLKQPRSADNTNMDKHTTQMMDHICDNICKYPDNVMIDEDELDHICAECKMGKFVSDILNGYNRTQAALEKMKAGGVNG